MFYSLKVKRHIFLLINCFANELAFFCIMFEVNLYDCYHNLLFIILFWVTHKKRVITYTLIPLMTLLIKWKYTQLSLIFNNKIYTLKTIPAMNFLIFVKLIPTIMSSMICHIPYFLGFILECGAHYTCNMISFVILAQSLLRVLAVVKVYIKG